MKHIYSLLFFTGLYSVGFSQYHYNKVVHFNDSSYYESINESDFDYTGAITIEAWINPDSINDYHCIVGKNYTSSYYFGLYMGALTFGVGNNFSDGIITIPVGEWTHVAVTYDGMNVVKFYVNGNLDNAINSGAGAIPNVSDPFRIGADQEGGGTLLFFLWTNG